MVGTKHCSWGRCNMDSRYPHRMPQSKNYKNRAKKCSFHLWNHGMIPIDARNRLMLALERTLRLKVSPRIRIFVPFIGQSRKDPQKSSLTLWKLLLQLRKWRKRVVREKHWQDESTSRLLMERKPKLYSHQGKIQSSFLDLDDVPEIVEDMNEDIMTENDKANQTDVWNSKYVLAFQIANRVERMPLWNQMNVSSEHVRTACE